MKLTYKMQITLSVLIIIIGNILTDLLNFWLYRSIGFVLCSLLFLIHPVVPVHMEANSRASFWTRVAGIVLIPIGIFTRVHHF